MKRLLVLLVIISVFTCESSIVINNAYSWADAITPCNQEFAPYFVEPPPNDYSTHIMFTGNRDAQRSDPIPLRAYGLSASELRSLLHMHAPRHLHNPQSDDLFNNQKECRQWNPAVFWLAFIHTRSYRAINSYTIAQFADCMYGCTLGRYHHYFQDEDFTTVMRQWQLYEYDGFWQWIKQFPQYEQRFDQVHDFLHKHDSIFDRFSKKTRTRICDEYQRIKKEQDTRAQYFREEQQQKIAALAAQQAVRTTYAAQEHAQYEELETYYELREIAELYGVGDVARIDKRIDVIESLKSDGAHYATNTYVISDAALNVIHASHFDESSYRTCYGNQLQHVIHQDCLNIINDIAHLDAPSLAYCYRYACLDFVDTARSFNQQGHTLKAIDVADLCRTLLDYSHAIAEGAAEGAICAVKDMFTHPVEAALCIVAGEYVLAFQLAKVLFRIADIGITYAIDAQRGREKLEEYTKPLAMVIDALHNKEITLLDATKGATKLLTYCTTQSLLISGCNKLYTTAQTKLTNALKNNPALTAEQYLATPDGSFIKTIVEAPSSFHMEGFPAGTKPKKLKLPPIPTEGPLWHFSPEEIEAGVKHVMGNKNNIKHIFGKIEHNLAPLTNKLGNEENTIREILKTLSGKIHFNEKFEDLIVHVANFELYTRGRVMDGLPKLGTLFIKELI